MELVLSEDSSAFLEVSAVLRRELGGKATVRTTMLANGEALSPAAPDLTIALGTRALGVALAAQRRPLIAALVPRLAFERTVNGRERNGVGAVFLDQPLSRQLGLIGLVAPGRQRVGLLLSEETAPSVEALQAAAAPLKLSVVTQSVSRSQDLYQSLTRLLAGSDVLLALPDPSIFNSGTIHNILLTTFRGQQPVFGFSPAYVRAGALAAIYSTPSQIGRQVAEIAHKALAGGPLPPPQFPSEFTVAVNATVASSLGLAVDAPAELETRLLAQERER